MKNDPDFLPTVVRHAVLLMQRHAAIPDPEVTWSENFREIDVTSQIVIPPEELLDFTDNEDEEPIEEEFTVSVKFEFRAKGGQWKLRRSLISLGEESFEINLSVIEMLRMLSNRQQMRRLKEAHIGGSTSPARNTALETKKNTVFRI